MAATRGVVALLLGTRRFVAHVPAFAVGARLMVSAQLIMRGEDNLAAFQCAIHADGVELANGDIKALRPDHIAALVQSQLQAG